MAQEYLNIIDANYNQFKKTLLVMENKNNRLEKENGYLVNALKKINTNLEDYSEKNKKLQGILSDKNKILERKKNIEKENKQLLKKISIISSESDIVKKRLHEEKEKNFSINKSFEESAINEVNSEEDIEIFENEDITQKNLRFFEMTNNIKKDLESHIIGITQIQKDVITHINSEDINNTRDWDHILRDISNFKNKKMKESFTKGLNSSLNLLISIAKDYTQ